MANPALVDGRKSSHAYGFHALRGSPPPVVPRPASSVTIMLRNPAIRAVCPADEGAGIGDSSAWAGRGESGGTHTGGSRVSSDAIGVHTGTAADRGRYVRPRTSHSAIARGDSASSPAIWQRTSRTSDAIGSHPAPTPLDWSNRAAVQYEATYARAFPGTKTPVANRSPGTGLDAIRYQDEWLQRYSKLEYDA